MSAASRHPFAAWLRRGFAAGGAALVFALTLLAASPELHHWLHGDDDTGSEDACAVVQFAGGVALAQGAIAVAAPVADWRETPRVQAREIYLAAPRYLRQPERGPPVG